MKNVELQQVKFEDLSSITHTVWVSKREHRFDTPELLVVRYVGVYRPGHEGSTDAKYIEATAKAAREAWYTNITILDFTALEYVWGDEMECVFGIGWNPPPRLASPLAVLVGDKCRGALKTLIPEDYDEVCRDDFSSAVELGRDQKRRYDAALKEHHETWKREQLDAKHDRTKTD